MKIKRYAWKLLGNLLLFLIVLWGVLALADLNYGSIHLLMGNPSQATPETKQANNYLMLKTQYALSYNQDKGAPNWVSWQLNRNWLGDAPRQNDFRPDTALPSGWSRVTPKDYTNSGFDRGHVTPSEDRGASIEANSATFLMTNMMPQSPDNNRGPWEKFEAYLRELVKQGKELYIIAGPQGAGGTGEKGALTTLAGGKITVPAATWKVVLVLDTPSSRIAGVTQESRTIAILIPNQQGIRKQSWRDFRQSVDAVEQLTGYDFFSNVPKEIQTVIEAKTDAE